MHLVPQDPTRGVLPLEHPVLLHRQGSILVRPLRLLQDQAPLRLELVQEEPLHLVQALHQRAAVSFLDYFFLKVTK